MKIYRTKAGIVIGKKEQYFLLPEEPWDEFINEWNFWPAINIIAIRLYSTWDSSIKQYCAIIKNKATVT